MPIGIKKANKDHAIFTVFSNGLKTNMDAWAYNSSPTELEANMRRLAEVYNNEVERFAREGNGQKIEAFAVKDPRRISWHSALYPKAQRGIAAEIDPAKIVPCVYRPFFKQNAYYDRMFNQRVSQLPSIFPTGREDNRIIMVKQNWQGYGHFVLMTDCIVDLQTDGGSQCFPLYLYEQSIEDADEDLLSPLKAKPDMVAGQSVSKEALADFLAKHPGKPITAEDIFYYTYAILHAPDYHDIFGENISKELPRVPCVKKWDDFTRFVEAGRKLGDLHVGYESVEPYAATVKQGDLDLAHIPDPEKFFRVEKMAFGKKKDRSIISYNANITLIDIPIEAYDYVVNGKSAIEWVMDRQKVAVDRYNPNTKKGSDIVNDPNRYAIETVGDPRYPYDLLRRVITVSLEAVKFVKSLPKLDI